jgi:Bacterial Ig-like domain (group 3)
LNYPGDGFTQASTTSITVVTVANFPSTTSLMASPNPAVAGQSVTLNVVVTPSGTSPIPTGNVVFLNGSMQLGTSALDATGKATFTTSFPAVGNQTITANYVGDTANQPSTASVVEAILSAFDFQPASGNSTITVTHGSSATLPITVSPQNGFAGSVSFTCSNLPTGATCSFNPASVSVSGSTPGSVTLTVSTASTVGSTSPALLGSRRNIFEATPLFGGLLLLLPGVRRGRRRLASLLCAALAIVTLGVAGCGGGTNTATVPATYSFNVVGTSGSVQMAIPYSLTVQ